MKNTELGQAYRQLNRIHRHITARYLSTFNLYSGQPRLLFAIQENPGITIQELVAITGNTKESISVSVKRMVIMGFIVRQVNPNDKREKRLHLTDKGQNLSQTIHLEFDALNDMMFDGLAEQENNDLIVLFEKMTARLTNYEKDGH